MLDLAKFNAEIGGVLSKNAEITINNISSNIFKNGITYFGKNRSGNNISGDKVGQNASGSLIQSLKSNVNASELSISGYDYIKTLEEGLPPGTFVPVEKLFLWTQHKNMPFISNESRFNFALHASNSIQRNGSLLYRFGGRTDVYTDEVKPLVERIMNEIGEVIVNTKIL